MPISDYTPAVDDIGALDRQRTLDANGNELGTFNGTTRPTGTQVASLIQDAINEAYPAFGEDIPDAPGPDPDALRNAAKSAVTYRAASLVELTHFGKEVARGDSPYEQFYQSWLAALKRVGDAVANLGGDAPGTPGSSGEYNAPAPVYDFPVDIGGMVGWETRW